MQYSFFGKNQKNEEIEKKIDKEGIMKAAKANRFYNKPSVKRRAKSKAALKYKLKKTKHS